MYVVRYFGAKLLLFFHIRKCRNVLYGIKVRISIVFFADYQLFMIFKGQKKSTRLVPRFRLGIVFNLSYQSAKCLVNVS